MDNLLDQIKSCQTCKAHLIHGVNPVVTASTNSKILIVGQAPGRVVHETSIPWNDRSGDTLRTWLDVDRDTFYNTDLFAIMPMGFCFPGSAKTGDLPPRKECAPLWHQQLLDKMPNLKLTILIGLYAQKYYLAKNSQKNLTENVNHFEDYLPEYFPLPHPSGRNNIWLAKHSWFPQVVLPELKKVVHAIIKPQ